MFEINKHRFFLVQILKDIYSEIELGTSLGFKGGTALMFFYDLPRFSVDLDFNLLRSDQEDFVFQRVRSILLNYGTIFDEARKFYGPILVLNYGTGERKLKIEISNRQFGDRYEIKNLLGINIKVMVAADLFAHKLCALLDRNTLASRDIFDCWFFMKKQIAVNPSIVESRMQMPLADYFQKCIRRLESRSNRGLLSGMGELLDDEMKKFVRTKLLDDTVALMKFYKDFPIVG